MRSLISLQCKHNRKTS
uniref:Uncharacterized protein n=1 Tax=Arundo donax TaxID=35708 RepID=A0A0A9EUR9_ARUDO